MVKSSTTTIIATISACVTLAVAQSKVTLYDLSFAAQPTTGGGTRGVEDQFRDILGSGFFGKAEVKASAVAVDTAGATYYVGVQEVTVAPTTVGGRLTLVPLATPSPATFTFRADASRLMAAVTTATVVSGVKANIEIDSECMHDVDGDTPVEDGVIVCKLKVGLDAQAGGQKVATTFEGTTTGQPVAVLTITNPANLTLPTSEPSFEETTDTSTSNSNLPTGEPAAGEDGSGSKMRVGSLGLIVAGLAIASQL